MPDEHKKGLDAELVLNDLKNCCKGEEVCGQCQNTACIVGYARHCAEEYQREPKREVDGGTEHIPVTDFKVFDAMELETGIAHMLRECKDCKEDHVEDCIINVIRNCYEVGLMGNIQPYEGSALQYLMRLKTDFPDHAERIAGIYLN